MLKNISKQIDKNTYEILSGTANTLIIKFKEGAKKKRKRTQRTTIEKLQP